jgi:hypothetical protein
VGTVAWWDNVAKAVTCEVCVAREEISSAPSDVSSLSSEPEVALDEPAIETGVAGQSALEEFERRHAKREARIDAKWGRLAGVVKFLSDDPQSTTAWKKGSVGERELAASLERNLGDQIVLLNDRSVPRTRGNIDHLVVASSGVWVVDAKNYSGLVQQRDVGGFFKIDNRLYVDGRDRSKVLTGMGWQVRAVTDAIEDPEIPIWSAVCFTDAEWGWFAKPFTLQGVYVSGPNGLARRIAAEELLTPQQIHGVASHLSQKLPPKP